MSDRIVTGIFAQVSSENQIFNYLLTDGAYHDPALAGQIVGGTARIAIASDATFDITESISFQPQGGNSGTSIGQIPIINDDGFFDSWARRTIAGMEWTVKRGYADQPWSEWATLFAGKGRGRPEFSGQRIIVTLTDRFGYMREPVAQAVFDDATANESLINATAPMVFGEAFQVRPALADPNILAYFSADNLAQTYSVAEGGNTDTPQWLELPQGFQMLAQPSLVVTSDIAGPPKPIDASDEDVLNGRGQFSQWSGGELDYPGVVVTENGATLTESVSGTEAVVDIPLSGAMDTGWSTGAVLTQAGAQFGTTPWVPFGSPELGAGSLVSASDGKGAQVFPGAPSRKSNYIELSGHGFSVPDDAVITGFEIELTAMAGSTSPENPKIDQVGYKLPSGVFFFEGSDKRNLTESYEDYVFGGPDDLLLPSDNPRVDYERHINPQAVNSPDFKLVFSVDCEGVQVTTIRVSRARIKVYYTLSVKDIELDFQSALEVGERYTVTFTALAQNPSDGIDLDWSQSLAEDDARSQKNAQLMGLTEQSYVFTAGSESFKLRMTRGGNGRQVLDSIKIRRGAGSLNRYHDLIRYLHTTAGEDPDVVCDNASLALVQAQADNPRLGWYVSDQTTREQLSTFLSHSLSAVTWGGIDGKWKAAQLRVPSRPDGDYLRVVDSFSEPSAVPDYADDLRDRVHAAKNFYPMPEAEAAGVTTNWDRDQREQILADWRITERSDPDNIVEYSSPIELTVTDIHPKWGLDTGGTEVTISGTGFVFGSEVVIGGAQATSVDVQSSEKIVAVTPAGTVGPVPVVVNSGGETYAMVGEFEYTAVPLDTPGQDVIFRASFEDASGRDPLATALLDRLSARKLAGHNVLCYEYPPMMAEKSIPVGLQDYDLVTPGRMIWAQDEYDPLFKMGRWAQIQSRTFGSNPLEVRLGVRISDHPESFKEFPGDIPILTEGGQPILTEGGQSILFG